MKLLESVLYKDDLLKAISNTNLDKLNGKSIFITGGLGLIGSSIVDVLVMYGKVDKIYVGARSKKEFQARFGGFYSVEYVKYDALKNLDLDIHPDYIVLGAGLASPELYTTKPVETILSNFDGVHALLEYSKNNKVQRILYISSSEVYGNKKTEDSFREDAYGEVDINNIRSSYAIAKRASEMLCRAYSSEFGIDFVIVRPGHIYGPSARNTDKRISSDFAYKAATGQKLIMKSSGLQKRSYCYSVDCAIQILTALLKGEKGEAYNIGNDETITIRQMAKIYAEAGNVDLIIADPTENELKAFNPMNNSSLNNSKVKKIGYNDCFTVEEGLKHTVHILKELIGI